MEPNDNLEDVIKKCVWKEMSDDPNSTTFQDVTEGHKLYSCTKCSGLPYSCPNYIFINKEKPNYHKL